MVLFAISTFSASASASIQSQIQKKVYGNHTIWIDCAQRSAVMFKVLQGKDLWNQNRTDVFSFDPTLGRECQQYSTDTYRGMFGKDSYHRGHLVSANALDLNRQSMIESFYMSNVVPQNAKFNTGAWLRTEEYQECFREQSQILVIGGVVYSNTKNDHFVKSHGIKTPDFFWKVIITGNSHYAWYFPNTAAATAKKTNNFLVSLEKLDKKLGYSLNLDLDKKFVAPKNSFPDTWKCDLS